MPLRPLPALAALLALGAAAFLLARPGRAEEPVRPYELRFVALSGSGSATTAWFEGAPAAGLKVQEALDRLAKEGFRQVSLVPAWRQAQLTVNASGPASSTSPPDPQFVLLLERGR